MTEWVILYLENNGEKYFKLDYITSIHLFYWEEGGYTFEITTKDNKTYIDGTVRVGLNTSSYNILNIRKDILDNDNKEECIPGGLFYLYNKLKN